MTGKRENQTVGVFADPKDMISGEHINEHVHLAKADEATYVHDWVIHKCKCGKQQTTIHLWSVTLPCPVCLRRYRSTLRRGVIKIVQFRKYSLWLRQFIRFLNREANS